MIRTQPGPARPGESIAFIVTAPRGYWASGIGQDGARQKLPVVAFAQVWRPAGRVPHERLLALVPDPDGCGLAVAEALGFTRLDWETSQQDPMHSWATDFPR